MARKRTTTLADAMAAAKLRGEDPNGIEVMTAADAAKLAERAASVALDVAAAARQSATGSPNIDPTTHACGIPGCRHGASIATDGAHTVQPDRQVKLACATCGAVARMTARAIHRAGGMPTCADGTPMTAAERRVYTRKAVAA